jgi:hypothetical protein
MEISLKKVKGKREKGKGKRGKRDGERQNRAYSI